LGLNPAIGTEAAVVSRGNFTKLACILLADNGSSVAVQSCGIL
jgi:hypothetical protein